MYFFTLYLSAMSRKYCAISSPGEKKCVQLGLLANVYWKQCDGTSARVSMAWHGLQELERGVPTASYTWIPILQPDTTHIIVLVVDGQVEVGDALGEADAAEDARHAGPDANHLDWPVVVDGRLAGLGGLPFSLHGRDTVKALDVMFRKCSIWLSTWSVSGTRLDLNNVHVISTSFTATMASSNKKPNLQATGYACIPSALSRQFDKL